MNKNEIKIDVLKTSPNSASLITDDQFTSEEIAEIREANNSYKNENYKISKISNDGCNFYSNITNKVFAGLYVGGTGAHRVYEVCYEYSPKQHTFSSISDAVQETLAEDE